MKVSARYSQPATTSYNKTQSVTVGKSLLWGGGGFLLVALIAFLISYFAFGWQDGGLPTSVFEGNYDLFYGIFWTIAIIGMIVGMILMMTWSFNIQNASWTRIIVTYICEILFWGCSFGIIMGMYNGYEMAIALGLTGLMFGMMGIIGTVMSRKACYTLGKIVGYGTLCLILVNLVFWMVVGFGYMFNNPRFAKAGNIWWMIATPLFTLFAMGYVAIDFYIISKSPFFNMELDATQARKVNAYYGLQLMTDFTYLLYWVLVILSNFKK